MKAHMVIILVIFSQFLAACGNSGTQTGSALNAQVQGTSSGGGGFMDTSARVFLDLAKFSLAEIVSHSSDEIYANFPEGKRKQWLADIIKKTQIQNVDEERYGRTLKFNYNPTENIIYATKAYVYTVENQRPWTLNSEAKLEVVINLYLDILHEISHLYGIGTSEATDFESAAWAKALLLDYIGTEKIACINRDPYKVNEGHSGEEDVLARAIVFNPSTGFSYFGRIQYDNEWDYFDEYNSLALQLFLPPGMQYESDNADFRDQYISLVNLALKHTTIDKLEGVISQNDELIPEAIVDLITPWENISDWSLVTLGLIENKDANTIKYTAYDELEYGSTVMDINGNISESENYFLNQEYTFEFDRLSKNAVFKITLLSTDDSSAEFLQTNPEEVEKTVNYSCEHYVKSMAF